MASTGCPIAGDRLYGGAIPPRLKVQANRQLLHASTLQFDHPDSGRKMSFTAPVWPDMQKIVDRFRDREK
jgi:23S rRNA pseudouridine1911/1915/1917 synthase